MIDWMLDWRCETRVSALGWGWLIGWWIEDARLECQRWADADQLIDGLKMQDQSFSTELRMIDWMMDWRCETRVSALSWCWSIDWWIEDAKLECQRWAEADWLMYWRCKTRVSALRWGWLIGWLIEDARLECQRWAEADWLMDWRCKTRVSPLGWGWLIEWWIEDARLECPRWAEADWFSEGARVKC